MAIDRLTRLLAVMVLSGGLVGCGDNASSPSSTAPAQPAAKPGIAKAAAEDIGPQGDYLPPLDGQRLEVAGPKGWVAAARDKAYVAQFTSRGGAAYPRVMVSVKPAAGSADLTSKTVKEFAAQVQSELAHPSADEDDEEPATTSQPAVRPLRIGDRYWVETIRKAQAKNTALERWILVTIIGGRQYTVELRVYIGALHANRPHALAVANSLRPATPASGEKAEESEE